MFIPKKTRIKSHFQASNIIQKNRLAANLFSSNIDPVDDIFAMRVNLDFPPPHLICLLHCFSNTFKDFNGNAAHKGIGLGFYSFGHTSSMTACKTKLPLLGSLVGPLLGSSVLQDSWKTQESIHRSVHLNLI
ncbi:hypothetical protein ACH5RR_008086 [Cinchona calisaya]|uniref:Uncharacterized protein n=1 Tax=Cinchona calisaya TaxID=153742 RepID=A0ABD3AAL3_9GENT